MANDGERNQNGSQFFMTTTQNCDWLDRKHTIFGKIDGQTIYNLIKLSELDTNPDTDRPDCDPLPKIERAIVIENPFDDIVPRQIVPKESAGQISKAPVDVVKKPAFKALKNKNLISFAGESEEEDGADAQFALPARRGIRAQHEAEGKTVKKVISEDQLNQLKKKREMQTKAKEQLASKIKLAV